MVKGSIIPSTPTVTRNISVSVTDGVEGIESVDVVLEDADENQYTGKTGSAGGCTISNVPEGSYTVMASKTGYTVYTGNITVSEENTTLTITLTAE
ncbi:carboxypeptidase-like regulatory domain-containing protein [Methanobrevibacter sp.]|uniref:carboxypeptidase-like regulatory domain-containing protein n=1 Tax=Methanobrevibacter sp. TaxID=66852 RepID=UPI0026DF09EA|nr:carboxypeptidase-like regulatory domain-containing protein [Methanobrevibacter sp.]MDO5824675.1 carboxypeptidase-like regulatory domain-containing protein [Methanobrevibacter sp.]